MFRKIKCKKIINSVRYLKCSRMGTHTCRAGNVNSDAMGVESVTRAEQSRKNRTEITGWNRIDRGAVAPRTGAPEESKGCNVKCAYRITGSAKLGRKLSSASTGHCTMDIFFPVANAKFIRTWLNNTIVIGSCRYAWI